MKTWEKLRDAVCGVQGTRTGALVSTVVGALSKPVGYLRTLLLAWLFGASAGMDAFYLAMGILSMCRKWLKRGWRWLKKMTRTGSWSWIPET